MKRILAIAAAMLMVCAGVSAQNTDKTDKKGQKPDEATMIQNRTNRMVEKYGLDETQAASLLTLNQKYAGKLHGPGMGPGKGPGHSGQKPDTLKTQKGQRPELTDEQKAEMKAKMEEMKANREAYNAELQKIMTADQYKAYQADMQRGPQGGHGPQGGRNSKNAKSTEE